MSGVSGTIKFDWAHTNLIGTDQKTIVLEVLALSARYSAFIGSAAASLQRRMQPARASRQSVLHSFAQKGQQKPGKVAVFLLDCASKEVLPRVRKITSQKNNSVH